MVYPQTAVEHTLAFSTTVGMLVDDQGMTSCGDRLADINATINMESFKYSRLK